MTRGHGGKKRPGLLAGIAYQDRIASPGILNQSTQERMPRDGIQQIVMRTGVIHANEGTRKPVT